MKKVTRPVMLSRDVCDPPGCLSPQLFFHFKQFGV